MRKDIRQAATIIKSGGIIIYPTDTVCGYGCDARNAEAIARILALRNKKAKKGILTLFSSEAMVDRYFKEIPDAAWDIFEYATTPTSLVLEGAINLASILSADRSIVAARVVKSGTAYELINFLNVPLVSISINQAEEEPVVHTKHIPGNLRDQVDFVLQEAEGELGTGIPSSIIRIEPNGGIQIIRK